MYHLSLRKIARRCHTMLLLVSHYQELSHMVTPSCKERLENSRQPCAQLKIGNPVTMEEEYSEFGGTV